jgi:hypothetical protein
LVCVNGSFTSPLPIQSGVKQNYTLAPDLFLIVKEILNQSIKYFYLFLYKASSSHIKHPPPANHISFTSRCDKQFIVFLVETLKLVFGDV